MAAINRYSGNGVEQTLEQYVPLPFEEMFKAGQAIQQRGDLAEQQQDLTKVGLASLETRLSGHSAFKDKFINDYTKESSALLDKYGANSSNPEFIRASRNLNMKYATDPRLQTIKQANERDKLNELNAAKLKMEGKLFINQKTTGLDSNGNLVGDVAPLEMVNTLQDWEESSKMAWQSMEDDGRGNKSNKNNLDRNRIEQLNAFKNNTPEAQRLIKAYQDTYGLNPQDAAKMALNAVSSNLNKYGIKSDKRFEFERLQLSYAQEARQKAEFNATMADKEAARKAKATGTDSEGKPIIRPRIEPRNNKDINSITGDGKALVIGSSTAFNPAKGTSQSLNLSNALILNEKGESTIGATGNINAINKGAVAVMIDNSGKIFNSPGKGSLSSDKTKITHTDKNGKQTVTQLRPIAAIEYYDPRTKKLIYQPLNKEQALIAGFDYNQTVDYKPAAKINGNNNKVDFNYNDINDINRKLDAAIINNPHLSEAKRNVDKVYNTLKVNNTKNNLNSNQVKELVNYLNDVQNQIYNDLYKTDLQKDFNNTSTATKQATSNVADEKNIKYEDSQLDTD